MSHEKKVIKELKQQGRKDFGTAYVKASERWCTMMIKMGFEELVKKWEAK